MTTLYTYYPTESFRVTAEITILGQLSAPLTLTLFVQDPTGAQTSYVNGLVPDSLGNYHQDVTLSATPAFGRWTYWWTSTGAQINQAGVSNPQFFYVAPTGTP
jgi:hypothetical protein